MPTYGNQYGNGRVSVYDPGINPVALTNLWKNCPLWEQVHDPTVTFLLDEEFCSYNAQATTGDYTLTQATTGTAAISTADIGSLLVDSGSTTQGQGANLQRLKSMFLPATGKDLWFEAKVRVNTSLSGQFFFGLKASNTTIIAANAVNGNNHLGFSSVTGDGVMLFNANKAGTATTQAAVTLVAGTAVRLGFYYDGTADTCQPYVNGVATGNAIATTYIPKVAVYPSFVCQTNGTTQPTLTIMGYRVAQLR